MDISWSLENLPKQFVLKKLCSFQMMFPQKVNQIVKKETSSEKSKHLQNDEVLLNIDDILGEKKTRVEVLILSPNGDTSVRVPILEETTHLVKNIALTNWKTVANSTFTHQDLKPEIVKSLCRVLSNEFNEYCSSDTVLKGCSIDQLFAFSNNLL